MTTLFDDPNFGMYEAQGGVLQNPGQSPPGIALAPPQAAPPLGPTQSPEAANWDKAGGLEKFGTLLSEFGAGVQGKPSPLQGRLRNQRENQLLDLKTKQEKLSTLQAYAQIAKGLKGEARTNFVKSAKDDLNGVSPGMGDTFGHISDQPSLLDTFKDYQQYLPATYQALIERDPDTFLKVAGTPEGLKVLQTAHDKPVLDKALAKAQTLAMGFQELPLPPALLEKAKGGVTLSLLNQMNSALPDGHPAKLDEDQIRVARSDPEAFAGALGVAGPKAEQDIIKKKAEDKGKRELTEIGVGKDAKGNDLFQKAYIEGDKVVGYVGEKYQKKDGVNISLGGQFAAIDTDPKSPTYGKPVLAQASRTGGPAKIIPNLAPMSTGGEELSDDAVKNLATMSLYDKTVLQGFSRNPSDRKKIENEAARQMKEAGITPNDVISGRAGFKADSSSLGKLTPQYDAITAFEKTAIRNGDTLLTLADQVDKTGVPLVEKWIRQGRSALGDPEVAKFQAQLQVYRTEAAKILTNPNLSGQLTDAARNEVSEFLKGGASADQIRGVVNLLKNDFENRKSTLEEQIGAIRQRMKGRMAGQDSESGAVVKSADVAPPPGGKALPSSGPKTGPDMKDALPKGFTAMPDGSIQFVEDGRIKAFPDRTSFQHWQNIVNGKPQQ